MKRSIKESSITIIMLIKKIVYICIFSQKCSSLDTSISLSKSSKSVQTPNTWTFFISWPKYLSKNLTDNMLTQSISSSCCMLETNPKSIWLTILKAYKAILKGRSRITLISRSTFWFCWIWSKTQSIKRKQCLWLPNWSTILW